ncbi:hypothetical protein J2O09_05565 [Elizabethkingia anophelis]|uniref:hypothetical protein n=1 Tax=Elizabethkingia anophelis TaxID=1117645 RepID=UPI0020B8897A|nr:hypothetical protein [Elizabethkingia anophelis]UTG62423.1 hypothetical protein J2O09_05565 [Elizabethkingia anophelis]UXM68706.1 hypothetical protein N7E57_05575 [Elizabethkingia anophelis]
MKIKLERLGEEAVIEDLMVYSPSFKLQQDLEDVVRHIQYKEVGGLSIMQILLSELEKIGLYNIKSVSNFEDNPDLLN